MLYGTAREDNRYICLLSRELFKLRKVLLTCSGFLLSSLAFAPSADALCSGPVASEAQLKGFDDNSVLWLSNEPPVPPYRNYNDLAARAPSTKLYPDTTALANEAIASQDSRFPVALQTMLATASADQGAYLGFALANLGTTCTTAADQRYVTAIARAVASSQNASANLAYGETFDALQTAATGGGGGGGGSSGGGGTQGVGPAGFFPLSPSGDDENSVASNPGLPNDLVSIVGGGGSFGSPALLTGSNSGDGTTAPGGSASVSSH